MKHSDDDMDELLKSFLRRTAPEGLKTRILEGSRRRTGEDSGRVMTPLLWTILAAECLALLLLLAFIPGKQDLLKYAPIFVSRDAAKSSADFPGLQPDIEEAASGLPDAARARLIRGLSFQRAREPRRPYASVLKDLED